MTCCGQRRCLKFIFTMYRARLGQARFYQRMPCPYGACLSKSMFCNYVGNWIRPSVCGQLIYSCALLHLLSSLLFPESIYRQIVTSLSVLWPSNTFSVQNEHYWQDSSKLWISETVTCGVFFFPREGIKRNDPRSVVCAYNNRSKSGQTSCGQYFNLYKMDGETGHWSEISVED